MKKKLIKTCFLSFVCLLVVFFVSKGVRAQAVPVGIEPADQTISSGNQATVDVVINNVDNLYGFQFDISYDSSVLTFVSLEKSSFIGDSESTYWVSHDTSEAGLIKNIAATRTTPDQTVSGSGILVSLTFEAAAGGTSAINIENLVLADPNADEISSTASSGQIIVEGDLLEDLNNDQSVNQTDIDIVLSDYTTSSTNSDINQDGVVNLGDVARILQAWKS